jgi:hypothetical protein
VNALAPLLGLWADTVHKLRVLWWKWARSEMPLTIGVTHPDMNRAVLRIAELEAQRPPIDKRVRSRCEEVMGLCAMDKNCPDRNCPGLHMRDGGHQYRAGIAWPIEHKEHA